MKIFKISAEDVDQAREKLASDLGIEPNELKCIKQSQKEFSFEAANCPAQIDIDLSPDKMKARIKRIGLPVGANAPKLTTAFVIERLKKKGIVYGLKIEVLTEELFKISGDKNFNDKKILNILVAEGMEATPAQGGRPQWEVDPKLFEKEKAVWVKAGDIIAKAPMAVKGVKGKTVTGEEVDFRVEEQFKLQTAAGIVVEKTDEATIYRADYCGQLFFDHGIRLRIDSKLIDKNDGFAGALLVDKQSFAKKPITAKDLRITAEKLGAQHGILSEVQIQAEIAKTKKWPAEIIVARGKEPVDGKAGALSYPYKKAKSEKPLDVERAKLGIVFPGESIAIIQPPTPPEDGMTVFGESLRGRSYNELPIYPGKNVSKENVESLVYLKATSYGQVKVDKDRISVESILKIEKDGSKATLDVFPQQELHIDQVVALMRDRDVLHGFNKEKLEIQLKQIHQSGQRDPELIVAESTPVREGKSAKLRYFFKPDDLKEKGVLLKTKAKKIFAAPGDLLMEKILPIEAEPGYNIYREKIGVPPASQAVDVKIEAGRNIIEKDMGEFGNDNDPERIQYRAATFGFVKWENKTIDLDPVIQVDPKEEWVKIRIAPQSDFKSKVTFEMIEELAREEGIRVELKKDEVLEAISKPLGPEEDLREVLLAEAIPAVHGTDSIVEYYVEYNGMPIDEALDIKDPKILEPRILDFVRPKEVVAVKTPAGNGEDGKTVFGRRIIADRGQDEPWIYGYGLDRSEDGLQLFVNFPGPGYLMIEDNRLIVKDSVSINKDRMSASVKIYPSNGPRFQPKLDTLLDMIHQAGVVAGVKENELREAIQSVIESGEAVEVVIAEGLPAKAGREARHHFAIEMEHSAGKLREDGSIDYKAGGVFQTVANGQLLLVKEPPSRGEDGFNVLGEKLGGLLGEDHHVDPGPGVKLSENGQEYYATRNGILEFTGRMIRVIEGLLINGDVDYSTGNIEADEAQVLIRGSVLNGFHVKTESDISIDKVAEKCLLEAKGFVRIRGGIIGKDTGRVVAGKEVEALYINSGATVECDGDVRAENECLNSFIRTGGTLICDRSPGTISGGEIWAFEGVKANVIGAAGSESPTRIYLGMNYLEHQKALERLKEEGLNDKEGELVSILKGMDQELRQMYDAIPEIMKNDPEKGAEAQVKYKALYQDRRQTAEQLEIVRKQKDVILRSVPKNKDFKVTVRDIIHPGTTFIYEGVEWVLKEPLKAVQISWNEGSSNFTSRRI